MLLSSVMEEMEYRFFPEGRRHDETVFFGFYWPFWSCFPVFPVPKPRIRRRERRNLPPCRPGQKRRKSRRNPSRNRQRMNWDGTRSRTRITRDAHLCSRSGGEPSFLTQSRVSGAAGHSLIFPFSAPKKLDEHQQILDNLL